MSQAYDVVIIGSGPGGYVAAIRAAQLKMKTALIELDKLGGVCLNWGCIPTKALLKSAELLEEMQHAKQYGIKAADVSADFPDMIKRSRRVADTNSKGVDFLMKKNKIDVLYGTGKLLEAGKVEVKDKDGKTSTITAKHIILSTGGRPKTIPGVDIDGKQILSSREAMDLKEQPESLLIIGAGAIGVEFAYFYNAVGTKVTVVEMLDQLLPIEDKEIAASLEKNFKKAGIKCLTSTKVLSVKKTKTAVEIEVESDGKKEVLKGSKALMAIGIQGNIESLNLEAAGVEHEKGFIKVNEWYETNIKGIYAIGDITGPPLLAHVASHEGLICIEKIAGMHPHKLDYNSVPGCTYCQPQVASLGMTEAEAKDAGYELKIGKFPYTASGKARAIGVRDGLVKLVFDKKYGELLGAHIIGAEATELIAELGVAKALESTPLELINTVHAHPTLSEMIMEAAADAEGRAVHI